MRGEKLERVGGPIDPKIVAVDAQERIGVDKWLGVDQTAAGFQQQRSFVGYGDVEPEVARSKMRLHGVGQIVDIDDSAPDARARSRSSTWSSSGLPATSTSGFGPGGGQRPHPLAQARRHDHRGRRHLGGDLGLQPQGLASAVHAACNHGRGAMFLRDILIEPAAHRFQARARQIAFEQAPHTRLEGAVMRLVVPLPQPREDAQDPRVPLRCERPIGAMERFAIAGRGNVAGDHPRFDFRRDVAPRVFEHGRKVICRVTRNSVLEVEQAEVADALDDPRRA